MKNKKIVLAILIGILVLLAVCSCAVDSPADNTDAEDSGGGDDTAAEQTTGVNVVEKDSVNIHSISELNTEDEGIDSHKGFEQYSTLELNEREYIQLSGLDLGGVTCPYYPRIRQMKNGQYIMTYQANRISSEVYYAVSNDGIRWRNASKLLAACDHIGGYDDTMIFMTADLCVLDDGTVIVVSAFRGKANYSKDVNSNGIVVIRSTDNGNTWSEKQIIYTGTNWEPYVMQTSSGEVQVYFTQTGHLLALHGWQEDRRSSCVGLLRSNDRGLTWTESKDYSAQIIMQQFIFNRDGYDYMCDQMPVAIELHDGTIALAAETCNAQGSYRLSVAYSTDNWAKSLGFNEAGPSNRVTNFMQAAGPYLAQFDSGETVLACHRSQMYTYIGNAQAKDFTNEYQPFAGHKGNWASLFVDSSHSIMGTMANETAGATNNPTASTIDVGRMYLNHVINAKRGEITVDGRTEDWDDNTSALFIGSETQAQMSMRFSYDDEKVYFLIERLDDYLTESDQEGIYVPADGKAFYLVKFGTSGIDSIQYSDGERMRNAEFEGIEWAMTIVGGVGDKEKDTGKILEFSIPRSKTMIADDGLMLFNAVLYNKDKNEKPVTDTFLNTDIPDKNTWQRIFLTK